MGDVLLCDGCRDNYYNQEGKAGSINGEGWDLEPPPGGGQSRLESVFYGTDRELLPALLAFYAPHAKLVVDVTANERKMWRGVTPPCRVVYCDIDPAMRPDIVCDFRHLPFGDASVDVLVFDPPHLPSAAASVRSDQGFGRRYGLGRSVQGDHVGEFYEAFAPEADRVLRRDGIVLAKVKDFVHNHRYQWMSVAWVQAVRNANLTPCDVVVKRDPSAGRMTSSKWQKAHHARNCHVYWMVARNGACEARD